VSYSERFRDRATAMSSTLDLSSNIVLASRHTAPLSQAL
jgi:hypothetical protein